MLVLLTGGASVLCVFIIFLICSWIGGIFEGFSYLSLSAGKPKEPLVISKSLLVFSSLPTSVISL